MRSLIFLTCVFVATMSVATVYGLELPPVQEADFQEEVAQEEETLEAPSSLEDLERASTDTMSGRRESAPLRLPTKASMERMSVSLNGSEIMGMVNPFLEYYKPVSTLGCCPRKWNYGCRSSSYRMPCFYDSGTRSWCCPVAPQIYARRCLCKQCAVLTSNCVQQGYCARRYTKKWMLAVCRRPDNGFWYLRHLTRSVPSSCYCKTRSIRPVPLPVEAQISKKTMSRTRQ